METPDTRAVLELDLTDAEFLFIAKLAHKHDITFNHMIERLLIDAMANSNLGSNSIAQDLEYTDSLQETDK